MKERRDPKENILGIMKYLSQKLTITQKMTSRETK
jgi:hypothetical protein